MVNILIIFLLGVLVGWVNENSSVGMFVILILYIIYFYFNNVYMFKYIISGYVGSLIGFFLLVIVLGVVVRKSIEELEIYFLFIFKFFMIFYFWVMYLFVVFIILVIVFLVGKRYFDFKKNNCIC